MPPEKSSPSVACSHPRLLTTPHPSQSQFSRASPSRRAAAATLAGPHRADATDARLHGSATDPRAWASTFPGPLVLRGDDLAMEPRPGGQTVRGWERGRWGTARSVLGDALAGEREREARSSVYVVGPPGVDGEGVDGFMRGWDECDVGVGVGVEGEMGKGMGKGSRYVGKGRGWETGSWISDVISYLEAFYHGLPVKQLDPSLLHFAPWEDASPQPSKSKSQSKSTPRSKPPPYISLRTSTFKTGIRFRNTPSSPFKHQLHLSDLLDLAIDILPGDAHALLLLVNHDLYEDDDDEFVCGRAYGGSRVAVVSTARYNPGLDALQRVERAHAWPGSHCAEYADEVCRVPGKEELEGGKRKRGAPDQARYAVAGSPLARAVAQHNLLPLLPRPSSLDIAPDTLPGLYLSRICRTASHELGHCFGIAHCVYYACCMQGSASIVEDVRQPPYLCPVDLAKVVCATGADVRERYEVLLAFCEARGDVHMFVAFGRWIRGRLEQIKRVDRDGGGGGGGGRER
ncbi:hypothetical protein DSL72_000351 [Monilinia vaccinii-corymbosi]|uniref:Uncharacterized protein n=1 Tax=Monilinia vaccinii-corymbosi TaxID=61207 RepID=A0A8A3NZ24_9HELO|nr:hypothetical protein DSL72_000351 [Monilinia vaccinii-corymbosi]